MTEPRSTNRRRWTLIGGVLVLVVLAVVAVVVYQRVTAPAVSKEDLGSAPRPSAPSEAVTVPAAGPSLDVAALRAKIAATVEAVVGVAPVPVTCPEPVELRAGATFTCTVTVEGNQLPMTVTQTDAQGNVDYRSSGWVAVQAAGKLLSDAAAKNYPDVRWTTTCADGKRVVVGGAGTTFSCTLSVVDSPDQSEQHTVRITNDAGDIEVT